MANDTYVTIFETVHGSRAQNLARTGSDVDLKGVVVGPAAWYLGFRGGPEQVELSADHVRYDIRKFVRLAAEKRYRQARRRWAQYQQWLQNRNPRRAALEARFGYDTKHAMHLVRLQRMAKEILVSGDLVVHRPDRDELLAIRGGAWPYDELVTRSDALSAEIEAAAATSPLPAHPDPETLDTLCVEIVAQVLG